VPEAISKQFVPGLKIRATVFHVRNAEKKSPERSGADICSSHFLEPDEISAPTPGVFGELNESDFQVGLVCR